MKKLALLLCLMTLSIIAAAQFTTIATSNSFEEPEAGYVKILKTKAGETLLIHDEKGDVKIKKYSQEKKLVFSKVVKIPFKTQRKLKANQLNFQNSLGYFTAVFTTDNQLVYIASYLNGRVPTLMRVLIDLDKGNIIESKEIGSLDKLGIMAGTAMSYGNVPLPEFYFKKDPNSDYYATVAFNSFESDRSKRIHVTLYNGKHEAISEAYFVSPDEGYKYMELLDLYVDGANGVSLLSSGTNTAASGGDKKGGLFMGQLKPGSTAMTIEQLPVENGGAVYAALLRYNPVSDKMIMVTNTAVKSKKSNRAYYVHLSTFNKDLSNFQSQAVSYDALETIAKTQFKRKENVTAIPQSLYINKDGSYSLVMEEVEIRITYSSSGTISRSDYFLKDLGVLKYDKNNKQVGAQYIPKAQRSVYAPSSKFYSFKEDLAYPLLSGTQFKSFSYVNAPSQGYLLYNDIAGNQEKMQKGKSMTLIQGQGDCEGYYFGNNESGIPKGTKVLNSEGKDRNLILFASAYYDESNNEYIVMNRSLIKGKKSAQVVWLRPQ